MADLTREQASKLAEVCRAVLEDGDTDLLSFSVAPTDAETGDWYVQSAVVGDDGAEHVGMTVVSPDGEITDNYEEH